MMTKSTILTYKQIIEESDRANNNIIEIESDLILIDRILDIPNKQNFSTSDCTIGIEIQEGNGFVIINGVSHRIMAPCLFVVLPGFNIQFRINTEYKMRCVVYSKRFITDLFGMSLRINEIMTCLFLKPIIQLDENECRRLELYVQCMKEIVTNERNNYKVLTVRHLTMSYFYSALFNLYETHDKNQSSRASRIAEQFYELLDSNYKEEHRTIFYASKICISEKYLYIAIKAVTGKTPTYWINYRIINHAKNELINGNKSIEQISYDLNFKSQSHFCRFFKKETGVTALKFRNNSR